MLASGRKKKCSQVVNYPLQAFLVWPGLNRCAVIEIRILDPLDMWQGMIESTESFTQVRRTFRAAQQQDLCLQTSKSFKTVFHFFDQKPVKTLCGEEHCQRDVIG